MGSERAKLFMSFDSLKGYYDMIAETRREKVPRRELSEDDAAALSEILLNINKGDMVQVTYYRNDFYDTVTGIVTAADKVFRRLTVVKTVIPFEDISNIIVGMSIPEMHEKKASP